MSMSDKQWEFLKDFALLIQFADVRGLKLTGGELWRPKEMQAIYYEDGRSKVKHSRHQDRLAVDVNLFTDGQPVWEMSDEWELLGSFWKSLRKENRWGGDFKTLKDMYHFERIL